MMGDRYYINVNCKCGYSEGDVYYAPTCGFTSWDCPKCGEEIELEEYTGISYDDCSNRDIIGTIIESLK